MHRRLPAALFLLLAAVLVLPGCWSSTTWNGDQVVRYGVRADQVIDLETRQVPLEVAGPGEVRLRNLAGRVTVRQDDVEAVHVEATVHARGRSADDTRALLDGMTWIEEVDRDGHAWWTLSWPLDEHQRFHYSTEGPGFEMTTTGALGRRVTVTTCRTDGVPTLYADLLVTCPADARLHLKNLAGLIEGERLAGTFDLDTAAGSIELGTFEGDLAADTGSGDITVGVLHGVAHLDTGSGDIVVGDLRADANLDTGSGDIIVRALDTSHVKADTGSGRIVLEGGHAEHVTADTGSGDIRVEGVAFDQLHADTGSGDITIVSPLVGADRVHADTGSGDVTIVAGADASFDLHTSIGSGRLTVGYEDARIRHDGKYVTGAVRGAGDTRIHVDTGSGSCTIRP